LFFFVFFFKLGGQGAPLAPLFHWALAKSGLRLRDRAVGFPVVFLNIGGVSNVTWIPSSDCQETELMAFDCGPGGALLDAWMEEHTELAFDKDGSFSSQAAPNEQLLASLLEISAPFIEKSPPKSLDREEFAPLARERLAEHKTSPEIASTLVEWTVRCIVDQAEKYFATQARTWLVCGGGRRNPEILRRLESKIGQTVASVDECSITTPQGTFKLDGDALEAQAFAFLAQRSRRGLSLSVPPTTGVKEPLTGGQMLKPSLEMFKC
jgi:anhydro-N-acetylmuramic acid kinase